MSQTNTPLNGKLGRSAVVKLTNLVAKAPLVNFSGWSATSV